MMGQRLARYDLLAILGSGGMGEVHHARDRELGRDIALKILPSEFAKDPDRLRRFQAEAKALATLNHPNIVTIYSFEESEGVHFLTMEYVDGADLSMLIEVRPLPPVEFFSIALALTDALAAAHEKGVIHHDLKPTNVMLSREDRVKVLDFGLATLKELDRPGSRLEKTTKRLAPTEELAGTLAYMSPEQLQGELHDQRSDIFSLGVVLYEMATGERPYGGAKGPELLSAIFHDRPRPISDRSPSYPPSLSELIGRCLEKEPDLRPASARALHAELTRISRECLAHADRDLRSIAVLPFADLSPEKDQAYFCEGLAEELLDRLTKVGDLDVAARTSSFRFKESLEDVREIGRQLNVATVLEGSVRKAGDRLRITVQLVKAADGYHLWSERYDREMIDVFAIQEEIAYRVVEALQLHIDPARRAALQPVAAADFQAYDYYLRGRNFYYQFRRRGVQLALEMFRKSIEHDPGYGRAYAGIADCCCYLYLNAARIPTHLEAADEASRKAQEVSPDLAEAHASRGQVLMLAGHHEEAEGEFEAAIRLDPQLFWGHYLYARSCFAQGKLEPAARLFERASRVAPDDYQSLMLVAQIYEDLGRPEDAADARRRGIRVIEERLRGNPGEIRALYMGANGLVCLGEKERALEWAHLALTMEPDEPMVLYNVACVESLAGQIEPAIDLLERAIRGGLADKGWVEHDNNLDPLRGHPRFAEIRALLD